MLTLFYKYFCHIYEKKSEKCLKKSKKWCIIIRRKNSTKDG